MASKVSHDAENVYFYAKVADKLTELTGPGWMLLFIDSDGDPKTGWLGYDVAVNRKVVGGSRTTVERNVGGRYEWGSPIEVPMRASGDALELAIPRAALGLAALPASLDFKWADNLGQTGDWSDFTLNGDAAPDDRFNYRAILKAP